MKVKLLALLCYCACVDSVIRPVIFSDAWRTIFPFLQEPSSEKLLDKAIDTSNKLEAMLYSKLSGLADEEDEVWRVIEAGRSFVESITGKRMKQKKKEAKYILQEKDFIGQQFLIESKSSPRENKRPIITSLGPILNALDALDIKPRIPMFVFNRLPTQVQLAIQIMKRDLPLAKQLRHDINDLIGLGTMSKNKMSQCNKLPSQKAAKSATHRMRVDLRPNGIVHSYSSRTRPMFASRLLTASQRAEQMEKAVKQDILRASLAFDKTNSAARKQQSKPQPELVPPTSGWGEWMFNEDRQTLVMHLREGKTGRWRYVAEAAVQSRHGNRPGKKKEGDGSEYDEDGDAEEAMASGGLEVVFRDGRVFKRRKGTFAGWWERWGKFKEIA
jgi:hypothetical protein